MQEHSNVILILQGFKNLSPRSLLSIQSATDIMPVREVVFLKLNYIYQAQSESIFFKLIGAHHYKSNQVQVQVSHVYFMKYSMMGLLQMPNIMSSN